MQGKYTKRVAKEHLVSPRRPRLTTSLILTSITICIVGLVGLVPKFLEMLQVLLKPCGV